MNRKLPLTFCFKYFLKGWKEIFFSQHPIFLTFFVTSRCNAQCGHCLYGDKLNKVKDELKLEEINRISKKMPVFYKLLFSGGEPFLREDIDELCWVFYLNNKVRQITIPTNGILSDVIYKKTSNILKVCKKTYIQIQLSIDGLGWAHDNIREVPKAFDNLMRTYYSIRELEKQNGNLEINFCFTFSSRNQDYIREVYDYLKREGSNSLSILLAREPVKNRSFLEYDFDKYLDGNKYVMSSKSSRDKNPAEYIFDIRREYQIKMIKMAVENESFKFRCRAGVLTAVINEEGLVYPCENSNVCFGSLREENYDFRRVWSNVAAVKFRKQLSLNRCRCTHESNIMTNISFSPGLCFKLPLDYFLSRLK